VVRFQRLAEFSMVEYSSSDPWSVGVETGSMTVFAIATWKAWTIPILIVIGIAGFLLRGLIDMASNWETGYGPDSKRATIQAFSILGIFVIAAIYVAFFG